MAVVWGEGLESLLLRCFSSERILLKTLVIYVAILKKRPLRCAIVTVASKVKLRKLYRDNAIGLIVGM